MIEVRCFHTLAEAAHLRVAVNALNLASARPCPFSTFEFFENFLRNDESAPGSRGLRLWFLAAFIDGELAGYLALKQDTEKVFGLATSRLGFLIDHSTDRPHPVARSGQLQAITEAFYDYLLGRGHEWSLLEFQQQDAASALFPPPASARLGGHLVREWPSLENGTIRVHWNSLAEYFHALPKKSRSNVSRQMRSLLAAGTVEYLASDDPATLPALFDLCRSIEPLSWKSNSGAALARHPQRIEYFKGLFDPAQPMRLSIQVLLLDGMPIAALINGAFGPGLYALHIVFDESLSALGPGSAVLLLGMRQAIVRRHTFFNLMSGFGYYKSRWLAELTPARTAQIYRRGSLPCYRRQLGDLKRRWFERAAAAAPALFNPARRNAGRGEATVGCAAATRSPAERQRISALIATARRGPGEFLSAPELRALMPFPTLVSAATPPVVPATLLRATPAPGFPAH